MPSPAIILSFLVGGMLLTALLMVSRMRLASLVGLFRIQAILLGLYALDIAVRLNEVHLLIVATLVIILKAILIPTLFLHIARTTGASQRLEAYLRPTTLSFVGAVLVLGAFLAAQAALWGGTNYLIVGVSFSMVILGLLLLITRKDLFGQGMGFLVMENGIFVFGLALTGGTPFFVEIGVMFDLLALFVLMMGLVRRVHGEYASLTTDYLRELID